MKDQINIEGLTKLAEQGDISAIRQLADYYYEEDNGKAFEWYTIAAEQNDADAQNGLAVCYEKGMGVEQDYQKAVEYYRESAMQGNVVAQCNLGRCYENGIGIPQNQLTAIELYKRAAAQGDAIAQRNVGRCYEKAIGVSRDLEVAAEWYTKAAAQGDAEAQFNLACYYENGIGVSKDYVVAFEWYTKAAEQGLAKAQNNLGDCYLRGKGVDRNYRKAIEWNTKAAEQGDAKAQCDLGYCYKNGIGVIKDDVKAVEWYTKAFEQGIKGVAGELGQCYEKGEGVAVDLAKAYELYMKGAEQGDADCMCYIGALYFNGEGLPKSNRDAVSWFEKSAKLTNGRACLYLGYYYQKINKHVSTVFWNSKAARLGVDWAIDALNSLGYIDILTAIAEDGQATVQYKLGEYYQKGEEVAADLETAIYWYGKAAENGRAKAVEALNEIRVKIGPIFDLIQMAQSDNSEAQYDLAVRYAQGNGVQRDVLKAYKWYQKAASEGNEKSLNALLALKGEISRLARLGDKGAIRITADNYLQEKDYGKALEFYSKIAQKNDSEVIWSLGICLHYLNNDAQAFECFSMAANMGSVKALRWVGNCFSEGFGVSKDYSKAVEWYTKAAVQGDAEAQYYLGNCYYNGYGVNENTDKAFMWYVNAGDQGYVKAQLKLGECFFDKKIKSWLMAAENGENYSKRRVGDMYRDGEVVEQDYERAAQWYRMAVAYGDSHAEQDLEDLYENYLIAPENALKLKDAELGVLTLFGNNIWKGKITENFFGKKSELTIEFEGSDKDEITDAQRKAYAEYMAKKDVFFEKYIKPSNGDLLPKKLHIDREGNYLWKCTDKWNRESVIPLAYGEVHDADFGALLNLGDLWRGKIVTKIKGKENLVIELEGSAKDVITEAQRKAYAEYRQKEGNYLKAVEAKAKTINECFVYPNVLFIDRQGNYGWMGRSKTVILSDGDVQFAARPGILYGYEEVVANRTKKEWYTGDTIYLNLLGVLDSFDVQRDSYEFKDAEDEEIRNGKLTEREVELLLWLQTEYNTSLIADYVLDYCNDHYEDTCYYDEEKEDYVDCELIEKTDLFDEVSFSYVRLMTQNHAEHSNRPDMAIMGECECDPDHGIAICFSDKRFDGICSQADVL